VIPGDLKFPSCNVTLEFFTFKCNRSLPNPRGPLSSRITSAAIASGNEKVKSVLAGRSSSLSSIPGSRKGEKYHVYSPKVGAEIGKLACNLHRTL